MGEQDTIRRARPRVNGRPRGAHGWRCGLERRVAGGYAVRFAIVQGCRIGRSSILAASSSPTIRSVFGSHVMGRPVRVTGVFAGADLETVHAVGVAFLRKHAARPVPEPCDILVTTNGGWPLDHTFYQCQKGLLTGLPILKPGGTFLFAAACEEGVGDEEFTDLLACHETLEAFMAAVTAEGAPVAKDQWALENLAKATRHGEILFWSDRLPHAVQESLLTGFVTPVASLQAGLERAFDKHGPEARVIVMPNGPHVLPFVAAGKPTDSIV